MSNLYNGWKNYATWRVSLEIFDGLSFQDIGGEVDDLKLVDEYEFSEALKSYAEEIVMTSANEDSIAVSYALAFMADVDYLEIAKNMIDVAIDEQKFQDEYENKREGI